MVSQFYERFKKEDVIDKRRKTAFIMNIPNAPALTDEERNMVAELLDLVEEVQEKAKRVAGTANKSVEKFIYRDGEGGAGWGMTVAKIDVAAPTLFAEVRALTLFRILLCW